MVTGAVFNAPTEGIIHTETHTKCFLGDRDCGEGTLFITESVLLWKCDSSDEHFRLQYPSISLHAISRDTNSFSHQCLYCLLESPEVIETEERDPYPDVTEVRFVPLDSDNLKSMYDALTACQELHPDDECIDYDDDDEMAADDDGTGELAGSQFYTADNLDNVELSEEGQAVLSRLQQNMQILSQEEFSNIVQNGSEPNGQFDDADDEAR